MVFGKRAVSKEIRTVAIAGLGLSIAVSMPGGRLRSQNEQTVLINSTEESAEAVYKNIQVLKHTPADQIIPAMQFITYSLGVECSYCHMEGAFERDDRKEKLSARKMIQMMLTIDDASFQGRREVTCYTCHRGSTHPLATPTITDAGTVAPAEASYEGDESRPAPMGAPLPEKIFASCVDSLGGASAISKLVSRVEKGTIQFGGKQFPIQIVSIEPGRRITSIRLPDGESVSAYDRNSGWTYSTNGSERRSVLDIPAPELDSARFETDLQFPLHTMNLLSKVRTERQEKVNDQDVYVVSGFSGQGRVVDLYFDGRAGLLVRMVRYVKTALGRFPVQIDYADYRTLGDVKIPFRRVVSRPGSRFTIQIEEARDNVPVDDDQFLRPVEK